MARVLYSCWDEANTKVLQRRSQVVRLLLVFQQALCRWPVDYWQESRSIFRVALCTEGVSIPIALSLFLARSHCLCLFLVPSLFFSFTHHLRSPQPKLHALWCAKCWAEALTVGQINIKQPRWFLFIIQRQLIKDEPFWCCRQFRPLVTVRARSRRCATGSGVQGA